MSQTLTPSLNSGSIAAAAYFISLIRPIELPTFQIKPHIFLTFPSHISKAPLIALLISLSDNSNLSEQEISFLFFLSNSYLHFNWKVLVAQACSILCNPMDCSLPGSSVHGILQASILEWVDFPFSRVSLQPRDPTQGLSPELADRFFTT